METRSKARCGGGGTHARGPGGASGVCGREGGDDRRERDGHQSLQLERDGAVVGVEPREAEEHERVDHDHGRRVEHRQEDGADEAARDD
eukprot:7376600-Prymnesium_polylepis.3